MSAYPGLGWGLDSSWRPNADWASKHPIMSICKYHHSPSISMHQASYRCSLTVDTKRGLFLATFGYCCLWAKHSAKALPADFDVDQLQSHQLHTIGKSVKTMLISRNRFVLTFMLPPCTPPTFDHPRAPTCHYHFPFPSLKCTFDSSFAFVLHCPWLRCFLAVPHVILPNRFLRWLVIDARWPDEATA